MCLSGFTAETFLQQETKVGVRLRFGFKVWFFHSREEMTVRVGHMFTAAGVGAEQDETLIIC